MGVHLSPGVWGVLATPFTDPDAAVDPAGLTTLAAAYEEVGAAGLTVLGVFGEAARLSRPERTLVLSTVRDAVALPLVAGATSLATAPLVEEVRAVQADGRGPAGRGHGAGEHPRCRRSLRRAPGGRARGHRGRPRRPGLPPGQRGDDPARRAGRSAAAAAVRRRGQGRVAADAVSVATLAAALDVPVFGGLGGIGLLDELAAGGAGAMTGYSFPEGLVACVAAGGVDGGFAAAREALLPHLPLIAFEQQPGIGLALRKACLQRRGLIAGAAVRPPAPGDPRCSPTRSPGTWTRWPPHAHPGRGPLMDLGLAGRTAVVAASTGGLGRAVAQALAAEGASVVVSGRRGDEARRIADALPRAVGCRST